MDNRSSSLIGFFHDLSLTSVMVPPSRSTAENVDHPCARFQLNPRCNAKGDHSRFEVTSLALSIEPLTADPIGIKSHNTNTAVDSSAI